MKNYNKPAASKLVARFDRELKNILMNDLKALKQAQVKFMHVVNNTQLSVA